MPEYDSDDERPDRDTIYEWGFDEVIQSRFTINIDDHRTHPEIDVVYDGEENYSVRIYDMRTRGDGGEKVCCRLGVTGRRHAEADHEDFDTLDEAAEWLETTTKRLFEYQSTQSEVTEKLNGQVTLE